ncbi:hypothetical protein UFOVP38_28 [uncultured Caudovirales phage]|uniref:Uncharacterized protein n=1 Tax=uncultured Caudovirales phage TaxID=2100421 RepID=A0A6J5T7K7_9CAUD|nr:hypothetical protein UFOVP38_28 [uncultured Caudovirales phage]
MLLGTTTMSFERQAEKGKRPDPGKIPNKM